MWLPFGSHSTFVKSVFFISRRLLITWKFCTCYSFHWQICKIQNINIHKVSGNIGVQGGTVNSRLTLILRKVTNFSSQPLKNADPRMHQRPRRQRRRRRGEPLVQRGPKGKPMWGSREHSNSLGGWWKDRLPILGHRRPERSLLKGEAAYQIR